MILARITLGELGRILSGFYMVGQSGSEGGFTLVEVLVVTVVIGVLAALAIPIFAVYKQEAFNTRAFEDLRSVITAEEAVFDESASYVACGPTDCEGLVPAFVASPGVKLMIEVTGNYFAVAACHERGDRLVGWDSYTGNYSTTQITTCEPIPPPITITP